ncbi:MAG: DeoR family transcriptional regulator [Bacteroidetes bacterium]|nr:DeoR family transcriptional regulator [Bacteroidota bacterium]
MADKREQYVRLMEPKARIDRDPIIAPRQKIVLRHVLKTGEVSSREYAELTRISESTARRDLQELILGGWLRKQGSGIATLYLPGDLLYPGGGEQRVHNADGDDACLNCM